MEIAGTLRHRLADSTLVRRITSSLLIVLSAVWLSANYVEPAKLLAMAAVLALLAAPLIAPRRHRYLRKPDKELDVTDGDFERNRGKAETPKRPYSSPHLTAIRRKPNADRC